VVLDDAIIIIMTTGAMVGAWAGAVAVLAQANVVAWNTTRLARRTATDFIMMMG
jgi:hypothetical protein